MPVLAIGCLMLTIAYAALMILYRVGWQAQKGFTVPADFTPATRISVLIPARNEAAGIADCLRSVLQQDYPAALVEILVLDDHSTDDTSAIALSTGGGRVRVLSLADYIVPGEPMVAYKKKALSVGVAQSSGSLLVTTDADCLAPAGWLRSLAALYEQDAPAMIIAPVVFTEMPSLAGIFQSLDFMTLQGITGAAQQLGLGNMANGANLAFSRSAFMTVNGYQGIDHLASGDDFLLLVKMKEQFPEGIRFLKSADAIMATAPQPDWKSFLQQRIRWASKSGKYPDARLTGILLLVYVFHLSLLLALLAALLNGSYYWLPLSMMGLKIVSELIFLYPVAGFFHNRKALWYFPFLQPLHICYILLAGFLGMLGHYEWKGRKVH